MSSVQTAFGVSIALVLEEIKNANELHRSVHTKRLQFAVDVCLVAYRVRTGYLVDAVFPPNPTEAFSALLGTLRGKSAVFKEVVFWHHAPTAQTFLVHISLLQTRITALLDGVRECVFIKLGKCPSVSRNLPHDLWEVLHGMRLAMAQFPDALVLPLSELFAEEVLIPLAAVAIDYPVAYVPASQAQTSFLEGEALDIYTVSFKWTSIISDLGFGKEHVLLKFSCPHVIASHDAELLPNTITRKLQVKFDAALERIGVSILVTHHIETLERVAL